MKFCIVGAGSVGGYLAVRLARGGHDVSVVARGAQLAAIRATGLRIVKDDGSTIAAPMIEATDTPATLGVHDVVVLTVKAHQITELAPLLPPLLGPETIVLPLQNGIPWWYFSKHGGALDGRRLETLDPGGTIASHLPTDSIVGCVAWGAYDVVAPGVIHNEGLPTDRFPVGELDGSVTPRLRELSCTLESAAINAPVSGDIRTEKWLKAWGNLALNPIGALCHASAGEMHAFGPTRVLATTMMAEAQGIAANLGITFPMTLEQRLDRAAELGDTKTSTQQDVEAGRPLEVDALLGAVIEIGRMVELDTPNLDALYACNRLLDQVIRHHRVKFAPHPLPPTPQGAS